MHSETNSEVARPDASRDTVPASAGGCGSDHLHCQFGSAPHSRRTVWPNASETSSCSARSTLIALAEADSPEQRSSYMRP